MPKRRVDSSEESESSSEEEEEEEDDEEEEPTGASELDKGHQQSWSATKETRTSRNSTTSQTTAPNS